MKMEPIYLFIDESGDLGEDDGEKQTTSYYTALVIQIESKSLKALVKHITSWRYVECVINEPKILPKREDKCITFLKPIIELHQAGGIKCSAVYLLKKEYSGPYLKKKSRTGRKPIKFRNFIHKELLEYHFSTYPATDDNYVVAIFDYHTMSERDLDNVPFYLQKICELPLNNIVHLDSNCSWVLQTAGQLANAVSHIPLGNENKLTAQLLEFISLKDITYI